MLFSPDSHLSDRHEIFAAPEIRQDFVLPDSDSLVELDSDFFLSQDFSRDSAVPSHSNVLPDSERLPHASVPSSQVFSGFSDSPGALPRLGMPLVSGQRFIRSFCPGLAVRACFYFRITAGP